MINLWPLVWITLIICVTIYEIKHMDYKLKKKDKENEE